MRKITNLENLSARSAEGKKVWYLLAHQGESIVLAGWVIVGWSPGLGGYSTLTQAIPA